MPGLELLNGRFGPYLAYKPDGAKKAVNYKLPKGTDVSNLSFEDAKKIIDESGNSAKKSTSRTRSASKNEKTTKKTAQKPKKS